MSYCGGDPDCPQCKNLRERIEGLNKEKENKYIIPTGYTFSVSEVKGNRKHRRMMAKLWRSKSNKLK